MRSAIICSTTRQRVICTLVKGSIAGVSLLVGALCAAVPVTATSLSPRPPDLLLIHGKILTIDGADTIAQALAVRHGKIQAVGTDLQVLALAGKRTQIIDLEGRTATPGLIDSHAHFADGAFGELYRVALQDSAAIADVVAAVQSAVARTQRGAWVQGDGWDEGKLAERRYVRAVDLDTVSPNNPVWLEHTTGHYGVANSSALRLAKIDATTHDPVAGTIDRDADGVPTGVLKESAQDLVTALLPVPTADQRRKGILKGLTVLHSEGMTAVKDPDIDLATWQAYRQLLETGRLTAHVCVLWHGGTTLESARHALQLIQAQPWSPRSLGDGNLISCGAKLYMDGSGGARTGWLYAEWNKNSTETDRGNTGYPATDPEIYRQQVRLFHRAGVHVGTHAIGDRAIDWVVDTYAQVLEEMPTAGLRHSIIHANLPTAHAIDVMAALQKSYDAGYPEVQPPFLWWIGDNYAGNFGPERSQRLVPLRSFAAHQVQWAGGSDYFVTPLPARLGLWSAVEREALKGTYGLHPFGTAESIDVHAALRGYTTVAARQLFLEDRIGSLEVGKDADIAVWDKDLYTIPSSELKELRCQITLFHGKVVYQAR